MVVEWGALMLEYIGGRYGIGHGAPPSITASLSKIFALLIGTPPLEILTTWATVSLPPSD
jgi:hypothetical protein